MNKPYYYVVWVEGLSAKHGEKIRNWSRNPFNRTYTLKMTEALRVHPEHVQLFRLELKKAGLNYTATQDNTFYRTSYAPTGTIWTPPPPDK